MFLISSTFTGNYPQQSLRASETQSSDKSVISATSSQFSSAEPCQPLNDASSERKWRRLKRTQMSSNTPGLQCVSIFRFWACQKNHVWWQVPKHQQATLLQQHKQLLHMSDKTLNMLQYHHQNRPPFRSAFSFASIPPYRLKRLKITFFCFCGSSAFSKSAELKWGNNCCPDTDVVLLQWNSLWLEKNTKKKHYLFLSWVNEAVAWFTWRSPVGLQARTGPVLMFNACLAAEHAY